MLDGERAGAGAQDEGTVLVGVPGAPGGMLGSVNCLRVNTVVGAPESKLLSNCGSIVLMSCIVSPIRTSKSTVTPLFALAAGSLRRSSCAALKPLGIPLVWKICW